MKRTVWCDIDGYRVERFIRNLSQIIWCFKGLQIKLTNPLFPNQTSRHFNQQKGWVKGTQSEVIQTRTFQILPQTYSVKLTFILYRLREHSQNLLHTTRKSRSSPTLSNTLGCRKCQNVSLLSEKTKIMTRKFWVLFFTFSGSYFRTTLLQVPSPFLPIGSKPSFVHCWLFCLLYKYERWNYKPE